MIPSRLALSFVAILFASGCAPDEEELRNGIVKLEFARGQSQNSSPFPGTAQIEATLNYRDCLELYYEENMDQRQDGPEGFKVFGTEADGGEGWVDRLCELDLPQQMNCSIESLEQQLDAQTPKLTIVYNILDDNVEGAQLAAGPFPNREEVTCMGGALPEVGLGTVRGLDSSGATVWNTETFDPTRAVIDQGGAITIYAKRQ